MTLMQEIEWEACLLEAKPAPAFERRFRDATGTPASMARYFAGVPWLEKVTIAFAVELQKRVALDPDLADLVGMAVSQDNSCRYCFAVTRAFLRLLGTPEARIAHLEQDMLTSDFSPAERAALEFARKLSRSNPLVVARDLEPLRQKGFGELEIAELCAVVALHMYHNRVSTLAALPPQAMERLPDRWSVRLLRPLLGRRLGRIRRRSPPIPLRPEDRVGPFAGVVVALDGIPFARALRDAIDDMLASSLLPRRAKLLLIAVVARSLGCAVSEQEARRLLRAEGLGDAPLEEILAHLASPVLDPLETVVIPFARETVWYQPAPIQRKARAVCDALSREQFLELAAAAALANVICRLGFLARRDS